MDEIQSRLQKALSSNISAVLFITSQRDDVLASILHYFQGEDVSRVVYNVKQFGVKEADELVRSAKVDSIKQKIFIVSTASLHWVAQNKILKTLEDSNPKMHFIFILEDVSTVLPTILSRAQLFDLSFDTEVDERVKLFLTTKPVVRAELPFLKKLLALKDKDDKKDREESLRFLRLLYKGVAVYRLGSSHEMLVLEMLSYGTSSSANFKMIFECLALSLPLVVE